MHVSTKITEGEKKALKATQEGFMTVSISGVWNWSSNKKPIEDLDLIRLDGIRLIKDYSGVHSINTYDDSIIFISTNGDLPRSMLPPTSLALLMPGGD